MINYSFGFVHSSLTMVIIALSDFLWWVVAGRPVTWEVCILWECLGIPLPWPHGSVLWSPCQHQLDLFNNVFHIAMIYNPVSAKVLHAKANIYAEVDWVCHECSRHLQAYCCLKGYNSSWTNRCCWTLCCELKLFHIHLESILFSSSFSSNSWSRKVLKSRATLEAIRENCLR